MRKGLVLLIFLLLLIVTQTGLGQEKIDINTASASQIQTLPGIGPVKAQAIIDTRPYATIDELIRVRGIGPKTLERLRPLVTVGPEREPELEKATFQVPGVGIEIITHYVREGDTLSKIAKRYLGIASAFPNLALYNRIKNPDLIYPGEVVRVPQMRILPQKEVNFARESLAKKEEVRPERNTAPSYLVNINTASASQIQTLPGIGPVKARAIIDARPYATIDGLIRVRGIGPKTLERLRPLVTVGEVAEPAPEAPLEKEVPVVKRAPPVRARIDINTASPSEIQTLPGIGPVKARAIIDARPYASIDELTKARGIGPKTLENLRPLITVGEVPPGERPEVRKRVSRKVNINIASQKELENLPGIGPKTARRIIEYRPFRSIIEIQNVPRIGSKTYEKLKDLITVEKMDINTVTFQELSAMPAIGPGMARSIIDYRESHGPFKGMREVKDVPGMDDETYRFLKSSFTIE